MKELKYHLINSGIAGALVVLGSLSSVITGELTAKGIIIGVLLGIIAGSIVFLNKFQDWFNTQDKCHKQKLFRII